MSCPGCPHRYVGCSTGSTELVMIGTSPGRTDRPSHPFSGYAARDLDYYLLPKVLRRERADLTITNVVGCFQDQDTLIKDPAAGRACASHHLPSQLTPSIRVVVIMGAYANRVLEVTEDLERDHGIPRRMRLYGWEGWVVPILHPAQAGHDAYILGELTEDFRVVREVLAGTYQSMPEFPAVTIHEGFSGYLHGEPCAIDTETIDGRPLCLSYSQGNHSAGVVRTDDAPSLQLLQAGIDASYGPILMHNGAFDTQILRDMGITIPPRRIIDTMVLAYHQGYGSAAASEDGGTYGRGRQSLKYLAWRLLRLPMTEYRDLIHLHWERWLAGWLADLSEVADAYPPVDVNAGTLTAHGKPRKPKLKPHPLAARVTKLMGAKDPADLYAKWPEEARDGLAPPPPFDLSVVPWDDIVPYAGTDAIATFYLYERLRKSRSIRPLF